MQHVFPNYYKKFSCIKGACRHSCCIGWEIDIDEETLRRYDAESGELGDLLRRRISHDGVPHFLLSENERCPFLRADGLCDLILARGEGALCDICREHPRFHSELPGRIESGLGLCCEEAARVILGQRDPVILEEADGTPYSELPCDDEIIMLRDAVIALLQNREKPIAARIADMLSRCGTRQYGRDMGAWAEFLLSLERLDAHWTELLLMLRRDHEKADLSAFDAYMADRETEYEQFAVYLVYRYFANAFDTEEAAETAAFAAFSYELFRTLGALLLRKNGKFDFEDQIELARLFSSEIEYSEENAEAVTDFLRT